MTEEYRKLMIWKGKRIEDCTRDELLACIKYLAREYAINNAPFAIKARALGQVEMMRRGEG